MSRPGRDRTWTLLLLRRGGGRVFEWSGRRRLVAGALAGGLLVVAALGAAAGWGWAGRQESQRVAELRDRVERLRRERARVRQLAARLDSVERAYGRIRRVMGGGSPAADGDVSLPDVPAEEEASARGPEAGASVDAGPSGEGWAWPLSQKGFVTRAHREGSSEGSGEHEGLDIAVPVGSYVRAARTGVVEAAGDDGVYGRFVRIRHADGYSTVYGHNRWLFVTGGDSVTRGEVIALSGNSGRSTAPHLHFEVVRGESSVDPERLLGRAVPREAFPGEDTGGGAP